MAPTQRKKGPDSAKAKEVAKKDSKKDDKKKDGDEEKPKSFLEKHVLKVQMCCMFAAFLFSVIPRLMQGHDRFRFEDSYKDPVAWYSQFAKDYRAIVGGWGYSLHTEVSERLHQQLGQAFAETAHVLDVGAGSGLVGIELKRLGFKHVSGIDVVPEIVAQANTNSTGAYEKVVAADVEKIPMEFANASFDAVLCVGTAGYLARGEYDETGPTIDRERKASGPSGEAVRVNKLLKEWLRVLKPGGFLGITVEDLLKESWEEAFHELQESGLLVSVETRRALPFMPNNSDVWTAEQKVHLYFQQKPQ